MPQRYAFARRSSSGSSEVVARVLRHDSARDIDLMTGDLKREDTDWENVTNIGCHDGLVSQRR